MQTKKIILGFIFIFLSAIVFANNTAWGKNYETVIADAKKNNRPILIFFSGSDWCKSCIKLKTNVLYTDVFTNKASEKFNLYKADLPYRTKLDKQVKKTNEALAEKYNKKGDFPHIAIINIEGKILAECNYKDCTPEEYFNLLLSLIK